jgi:hypothetical protein
MIWSVAMSTVETSETIEPLALSPEDAAAFLSISRRALSDLVSDGSVLAKKRGTSTLVSVASLRAYYASLPKYVSGSIPNAPQMKTIARNRKRRKAAR